MLKVGLIGFGLAGQSFHAPSLCTTSGVELACILERSGSVAKNKRPDARVARSLDELLSDEHIQLCVVATPNPGSREVLLEHLREARPAVHRQRVETRAGRADVPPLLKTPETRP